jgi:hypothetical protein
MKTIRVNDTERLYVADQGVLGVTIGRAEKRSGEKRFKTIEETLVPRDVVGKVAEAMLKAIGAVNIDWEI